MNETKIGLYTESGPRFKFQKKGENDYQVVVSASKDINPSSIDFLDDPEKFKKEAIAFETFLRGKIPSLVGAKDKELFFFFENGEALQFKSSAPIEADYSNVETIRYGKCKYEYLPWSEFSYADAVQFTIKLLLADVTAADQIPTKSINPLASEDDSEGVKQY